MTINEPHDHCRYLFDENRKTVADWREKHWKDTK